MYAIGDLVYVTDVDFNTRVGIVLGIKDEHNAFQSSVKCAIVLTTYDNVCKKECVNFSWLSPIFEI